MAKLKAELLNKLSKISGLEHRPSRVAGGTAIFFKGKEIAHFHHNNEIDVRLTKKVIKGEGLSHPDDSKFHHHRTPNSEWIELRFRRQEHLKEVVRLFQLAIKQY
ncbi:MAG: DUF5519 family protein [Halobacteriovoraceae bacterium]|nr:DUF5519 family protein [Halobacteriovoraceae bacterium]